MPRTPEEIEFTQTLGAKQRREMALGLPLSAPDEVPQRSDGSMTLARALVILENDERQARLKAAGTHESPSRLDEIVTGYGANRRSSQLRPRPDIGVEYRVTRIGPVKNPLRIQVEFVRNIPRVRS